MSETFVIVGAGQVAVQAVDSLRREGFRGRLVLIGAEPDLPYARPPLSKKHLAGELALDRLLIKPAPFYAQHEVELMLGRRAVSLDPATRTLVLDDGARVGYERLLLATGAVPRTVTVPGHDSAGVHVLRTVADVTRIRAELPAARHVVIVGAGYIGLEVAATLRKLGLEVDVLEMADRVMARVVAPAVSQFYAAEHAREGVRIHTGTVLAGFEAGGDGRVSAVLTLDGRRFAAELVVVGVGVAPETTLADQAGLVCENGIVVDEYCRTSDAAIFAAGDCTSHPSLRYGRRVRLESVDNAFEQAKTAAANMLGQTLVHDKVPWFWSDQYDLKLLIVGLSLDYDLGVLRGDPATRSFSYCYLRDGELIAIDCVNNAKDYMVAKKIIQERVKLDPKRLAEASVALRDAAA